MTTRGPAVIASMPNIVIVSPTPGALIRKPPTPSNVREGNGRQSDEGHMNYDALPQFVLAKLLALDEAVAALKAGADAVERGIEDRRARLYGNVRRADDNPRSLQAELEKFMADQKVVQQRLQAEQSVISACKAWLDRL